MITLELRNRVVEYVNSEITIRQMEDWLISRTPKLLRDPNSVDADIVAALQLALVELSEGVSEATVRSYLKEVIDEYSTSFEFYPMTLEQRTVTSSSTPAEMEPFSRRFEDFNQPVPAQ